jgi:hypothetical protein
MRKNSSDGPVPEDLERRILGALKAPGRTEDVRKIAARFGVDPSTQCSVSAALSTAQAWPREVTKRCKT